MTAAELEAYLHGHIPLAAAMQVSVRAVDSDGVTLAAPLAPNINHRDTVFGGSASAVAILAAWSLLHTRMLGQGVAARLVIQSNTMDYDLPILGAFSARSSLAEPQHWPRFTRTLARMGRARLRVNAVLESDDRIVGRLSGEFVALVVAPRSSDACDAAPDRGVALQIGGASAPHRHPGQFLRTGRSGALACARRGLRDALR